MSKISLTPRLIAKELERRGYKTEFMSESQVPLMRFTTPAGNDHYLLGRLGEKTSAVGSRITTNKMLTSKIAERLGVPIPETIEYSTEAEANAFLARHKKIVVKPLDSAHGAGITTNITDEKALIQAIAQAKKHAETVLLQRQVSGRDLRLLFIGGELCAASERQPASVIGDGEHSLRELIAITNTDQDRGENYEKSLNVIPIEPAERFLGEAIDSHVPAKLKEVVVVGTANIGTGGKAIDATDSISPELVAAGKTLLAGLKLEVGGVDFIEDGAEFYFIEANNSPDFALHLYPHEGESRDVTSIFVDWLTSGLR